MAYFFILFGALLRVIPHPANFAPIAALALFGGTYLNKRVAVAVTLGAMILSDIFLGFDSMESRLVIYGCFILSVTFGFYIRNHKNVATIVTGSLLSSVIFFLASNFVWLHSTEMYAHTWAGMIQAYTNGLPFFKWTLAGDLVYTAALFGSYEFAKYLAANKSKEPIKQLA